MNIIAQWKIQAIVEGLALALTWLSLFGWVQKYIDLEYFLAIQATIATFTVIWWLSWSYRQLKLEMKTRF